MKRLSPKKPEDKLETYKQNLLSGMQNVVFDNYDSIGMFAKEMQDSEVRPKKDEFAFDNKVKINVDMVHRVEKQSSEDKFMSSARSL